MGNAPSVEPVELTEFVYKSVTVFAERESTLVEIPTTRFSKIAQSPSLCVVPDLVGGTVGLRIWPGSLAFVDQIAKLSFNQGSVIELGCGVGLPGMFFGKKISNSAVLLTDRESVRPAVERAICANGLSNCSFASFDWGSSEDLLKMSKLRFDLVIASEIVYAEEMEPLMNALEAVVKPHTTLAIQYTPRSDTDVEYFEKKILSKFRLLDKFEQIHILAGQL